MNGESISMRGIAGTACALALACAAAQAEQAPIARFEIDTLPNLVARAGQPSHRSGDMINWTDRQFSGQPVFSAFADEDLRARWWWGRGAFEVGAGADWAAPPRTALAARTWSPVVGVRAALSSRTRIVYEAEPGAAWRAAEAAVADQRSARFALEFKTRAAGGDLRSSLLRVQLSGDSTLHFRPRSSGLQLHYRARF